MYKFRGVFKLSEKGKVLDVIFKADNKRDAEKKLRRNALYLYGGEYIKILQVIEL